jgi:aminopeptidase N
LFSHIQTFLIVMANITNVEPSAAAPSKKPRTDDTPVKDKALNAALAASTKANPPGPKEIHRLDYVPLIYKVTKVSLDFNLFERRTVVKSILTVEKIDAADVETTPADANKAKNDAEDGLHLDGDEGVVALYRLSVDGCDTLVPDVDYILKPGKLIIKAETLRRGASNNPDGDMIVRSTVEIVPEDNTQLSGLYKDGSMFCSQCEAEGFRRITYYPDR